MERQSTHYTKCVARVTTETGEANKDGRSFIVAVVKRKSDNRVLYSSSVLTEDPSTWQANLQAEALKYAERYERTHAN